MLKHPALTENRLRLALPRIEALIYPESAPIDAALWEVHGEPVPFEKARRAKFSPCTVGCRWGGRWDTAWFRFRGTVPKAWKGREVVARVRLSSTGHEGFTAEGLVYREGRIDRAINLKRDEVEIARRAKGGEKFEFLLEAAANRSLIPRKLESDLNLPRYDGEPEYQLERAELAIFDRAVFDFYYDFKVGVEAVEVLPENSPRRGELVYALNAALNAFEAPDGGNLRAAAAILKPVLARRNGGLVHTISAVGHAHLDTAWLWPLRETIRKCARTFSTALDYMEKYPEYVFVCSQAVHYEWMKVYYPEIFARIKKAVKRGQWEPVGSMWIEPDCNLASGESLVRQILHGKRFFREEFGYETKDVWLPDVFGYAASMPQIMKKSGIDYFLTQKISWSQFNKFPHHTFEWEGIDGTRIFTHFPPADTYNAQTGPKELAKNVNNFREHDRATRSLLVYGWGDGGGGPDIEHLEKARRLRDFDGLPKLEQEKALTFFEKAAADAKDLPLWVGELYLEFHRGTYTTQAKTKRGNRKSELLLRDAEFFDAVGALLVPDRKEVVVDPERAVYDVTGIGGDPNSHRAALLRAWRLVLLNQFHDIVPGSSIHWVYLDAARDYETIRQLGESVRDSALGSLAAVIDTSAFSDPVLVANTLGFARREVVEIDGTPQLVEAPACGYQVQQTGDIAPGNAVSVRTKGKSLVIDNGLVRLTIDAKGNVSSLFDLRAQREALAGAGNVFQLHTDIPNAWDAWDVDVFYKETSVTIDGLEKIEVVENGGVRAVVRIVRAFGNSRIDQRIVVNADSARVNFETKVDWHECRKLLKVAFPVNVRAMNATYEIQYGQVERPTHANTSWDLARFEVCAQRWADLSEPGFGVAILNDCKYGHDIQGSTMRLSLLRAPISPDPVADRGSHEFTYAILPHAGGDLVEVRRQAAALNTPLIVRTTRPAKGNLPSAQSLFTVDRPGVVIEVVKRAEDGKGLIVRLYETEGGRGSATLTTTLPVKKAWATNLLEENETTLPLRDGKLRLEFQPFEIVTLRLQ
jgi:Alpha-mannosidase